MKKAFSALLCASLFLTTVSPIYGQDYSMETSSNLVAMTQEEEITVSFKTDLTSLENLSWYYGDKLISQYKTYNKDTKKFDGQDYITFSSAPSLENGNITATLKFGLLFNDTHTVSNLYLSYIGEQSLVAKDAQGNIIAQSSPIKLNVYDSYLTDKELQSTIKEIETNAAKDRYVKLDSYGTTVQGKKLDYIVIAKDKADVYTFINSTNKKMLENPQAMIDEINSGKGDYKIPLLFSSIHASEQPNSDAVVALAQAFSKEATVDFTSYTQNQNSSAKETDKTTEELTLDVNNVLDNFILVFSFTQNPDGDATDVRQNAYGFDPNRDNGYQIFPEQQAMAELINKYNPLVFLDYHGFVSGFLIEPCTPPHDPNTESDILIEGLLSSGHAIGKAGTAHSKYESYEIPLLDYKEGWDDAASAYTATYSLFHGVIGHTVEVPEKNEESFNAALFGGLGAIENALENKDKFMLNKLEIYKRGINEEETKTANDVLVNPDGSVKGRLTENGQTFFPDYYIIPVKSDLQKSPAEAHNLVTYFERNGVDVEILSQSTTINNITYPQGSYVVNMAQAKRGYANHVLYQGSDESAWGEMYAEIVMNFPDLRGFDAYPIYDKALTLKTSDIAEPKVSKINVDQKSNYILANDTAKAVKTVNQLLDQGKEVYIVQEGINKGNFIVNGADIADTYKKNIITLTTSKEDITKAKKLTPVKIYNTGEYQTKYVLEQELGFTLVDNAANADIIIDASGNIDTLGTKPFIAIGGKSMEAIEKSGKLAGFDSTTTDLSHEGLVKVNVTQDTMLSASYDANDKFYTSSGTWIDTLPQEFKAVATIENTKDFFVSGWWPNYQGAQGKIMIAQGKVNDNNTVIIAGNPQNRGRTVEFFNWITNAIYQ